MASSISITQLSKTNYSICSFSYSLDSSTRAIIVCLVLLLMLLNSLDASSLVDSWCLSVIHLSLIFGSTVSAASLSIY